MREGPTTHPEPLRESETRSPAPGPRARKARERRCVVSRQVMPEERLVRLAIDPEGVAVPDAAARLPGRGVWVEARREAVDAAVRKGLIARSAGRSVTVSPDLSDRIEALLEARCLAQLGLAKRAGDLAVGFDQVHALLKRSKPAYMIEARDGAADGRGKLLRLARAAWGETPVAGAFHADALGDALGRGPTAHLALAEGPAARKFAHEFARLAGFRPATPPEWGEEFG